MVHKLQQDLKQLGLYSGSIDGSYGPMTRSAVRAFQSKYGLVVDGSAGPRTLAKLMEVLKPTPKTYNELWLNKQTKVVSIPLSSVTMRIMANKRQSVRNFMRGSINKPLLAFNGGFFVTSSGRHLNYLKSDGVTLTQGVYSKYAMSQFKDGRFDLVGMLWALANDKDKDIANCIGGSPTLVIGGKKHIDPQSNDKNLFHSRHPRLAFGMDSDNLYIIVVHGRNAKKGYVGATINELADICLQLKLTHAINLDGGGSVSVYDSQVKRLDNHTENRSVASIVALYER
jgi:hypothetical protein